MTNSNGRALRARVLKFNTHKAQYLYWHLCVYDILPNMGKLMTTTFFNFLLGFAMMLSLSLGIIYATGKLYQTIGKAKNSATAFIAEIINE